MYYKLGQVLLIRAIITNLCITTITVEYTKLHQILTIQISNLKNIRNSNYYVGILYSKDYCDSNLRNKQRSNSETLFNN